MYKPGYLKLYETKELEYRIHVIYRILESCELCPRKCKVNRLIDEKGYCKSGKELVVSSYGPHFGEEESLVGEITRLIPLSDLNTHYSGGSGTIFLTNCNLLCRYCQNYNISHLGYGILTTEERVANYALELQQRGCHNVNFVTPTHYTPQIIKSISIAAKLGLKLPIVWNCSGYENVETIKLLNGIVDIYMPDIKYGDSEPAEKYSNASDYFERCKESLLEMYHQVGDLQLDERGIAYKGLLIRHLVLPNDLAGSKAILKFIAEELSLNSYVNIMSQYRPEGEANQYSELNRRPTRDEYFKVIQMANKYGLTRGLQEKHLHDI